MNICKVIERDKPIQQAQGLERGKRVEGQIEAAEPTL